MYIEPMDMAYVRMALQKAAQLHLSDPNVGLIDFGLPEQCDEIIEDDLAIRFHVYQKHSRFTLEAAIERGDTNADLTQPIVVGGFKFKTDVIKGNYRTHFSPGRSVRRRPAPTNPRAVRTDLMQGGISISDERHNGFGTLGGLVRDRATGAEMILSNWHVLVADWGVRPGLRIFQPGRLDGGSFADTVATLTRDAMSVNLDAAVAALTGARRLINEQFGIGPVRGVGQPRVGMQVIKSGRRSNVTVGRVTSVNEGIAKMRYGSLERTILKVMTIKPLPAREGDQVSGGGDSGSWWLDAETGNAVGLHFAGQDQPETALAIDMQSVLNALNVDIVL